jgi:ADP-ribose pyrophosphatase YjhB (NUDIX family)
MTDKVLAYITRKNDTELLVFRHKDFPEAGLQVPAGTVDEGEDVLTALYREIEEESGLIQLKLVSHLATVPYSFEPRNERGERHIFHLRAPDELPETWLHVVTAGEEDKGLYFEYSWAPLAKETASLLRWQGDWLDRILLKPVVAEQG